MEWKSFFLQRLPSGNRSCSTPRTKASNATKCFLWWRHHEQKQYIARAYTEWTVKPGHCFILNGFISGVFFSVDSIWLHWRTFFPSCHWTNSAKNACQFPYAGEVNMKYMNEIDQQQNTDKNNAHNSWTVSEFRIAISKTSTKTILCQLKKNNVNSLILMFGWIKLYDNVMIWKRFLHYWPFVGGIYRWPFDSPHKWSVMRIFDILCKPEPAVEQRINFPVIWDAMTFMWLRFDTLRPRQYGRHFANDIFKFIFLNENVWIPIKISLKFVPQGPINNITALVQIMAWRRPGDKPLSEPMMVRLPTHICVTRPQWVKEWRYISFNDPTIETHPSQKNIASKLRQFSN